MKDVGCRLLVRGVGDTYLVHTQEHRFVLRVYRSSHRTPAQIQEEVNLLLALRQAGVSVSYPLLNRDGQVILSIQAVEGARNAVLFTYAPGHVVKQMNEAQLRNLGLEMARFHNVSAKITVGDSRWTFDIDTTLYQPLQMLKPVFTKDPEGYAWLQQAADKISQKLSLVKSTHFAKGYCHYDFLPKNFHFDHHSITLFDFDFMGYGWLVNDIMTFWQHLALEVYTGRMTQQAANHAYKIFLSGYCELRSVTKEELATVPYLAIGFWLYYMAFHTTHDQFYAFSQPAQVALYLGFLKHIALTYWDKDAEPDFI